SSSWIGPTLGLLPIVPGSREQRTIHGLPGYPDTLVFPASRPTDAENRRPTIEAAGVPAANFLQRVPETGPATEQSRGDSNKDSETAAGRFGAIPAQLDG